MGIGRRIREARLAKGFTQASLAKKIGITSGAIGNYENETSHPKEDVLYALIKVLDVDANYLFQDMVSPINQEKRKDDDYATNYLERQVITHMRKMNDLGRGIVAGYAERLAEDPHYRLKDENSGVKSNSDTELA